MLVLHMLVVWASETLINLVLYSRGKVGAMEQKLGGKCQQNLIDYIYIYIYIYICAGDEADCETCRL